MAELASCCDGSACSPPEDAEETREPWLPNWLLTVSFYLLYSSLTRCAAAGAVAARMGSGPWQGVQGFFHGAVELAGKVPSAAWSLAQDVLDAVIRWWISSDKRVFLLPAAPPALQALGVCSTGRFKTFLQKVRDFFSGLTDLIKTGVPFLLY